jgi:hypothetical protein
MSVKSLQKQLLAAIAMVIVAAIAMSSATFAWFVNNSQVTATGATVTATTSKLLLISTNNTSYGTSTDLGIKLDSLTPVSAGNNLIKAGKFYKVKSWANGDVSTTNNPYGVLANTYVLASGGAEDSDDTTCDYAVQTIYLKSDVAGSTIALDSTTTQLTATKTVKVGENSYKIVSTYSAGTTSSVVYMNDASESVALSTVEAVKDDGALLEASLGALRVALVPYGDATAEKQTAGTPIVLTTSKTSTKGYYNTNTSAAGFTAANLTADKVVSDATAVTGNNSEFTATLDTDPAAEIADYTAEVNGSEVKTPAKYNIGTLEKADTPYKWMAYIYIEGCDRDCVSTIAGNVEYGVQLGFIQSVGNSNTGNSNTGDQT